MRVWRSNCGSRFLSVRVGPCELHVSRSDDSHWVRVTVGPERRWFGVFVARWHTPECRRWFVGRDRALTADESAAWDHDLRYAPRMWSDLLLAHLGWGLLLAVFALVVWIAWLAR